MIDKKSKNEYLKTDLGQINRYKHRRLRGWSYYTFVNNPKSKKSIKINEIIDFQNNILSQVKEQKKNSYRSKIITEIFISSNDKNPPHIHTIIKNYFDLFSKPNQASQIKRKNLIYNDDSQISYISVYYRINDKPRISASFYPLRYFIEDLILSEKILHSKFEVTDNNDQKLMNNELIDDIHAKVKDLEKNKQIFIDKFGEKTFNSLLVFYKAKIQEHFLSLGSLSISDLYQLYKSVGLIKDPNLNNDHNEIFREIYAQLSNYITHNPIKLKLPQIPTEKDETEKFKKNIKKSINEFKSKYAILNQIYIPIGLDVVYKPPKVSFGFSKDLDNIMRIIIPIFNDAFKPPVSYISNIVLDNIEDEEFKNEIALLQKALPKSVEYSIVKYEIFEIHRHIDDLSEGFISIGITKSDTDSKWRKITNVIDSIKK